MLEGNEQNDKNFVFWRFNETLHFVVVLAIILSFYYVYIPMHMYVGMYTIFGFQSGVCFGIHIISVEVRSFLFFQWIWHTRKLKKCFSHSLTHSLKSSQHFRFLACFGRYSAYRRTWRMSNQQPKRVKCSHDTLMTTS